MHSDEKIQLHTKITDILSRFPALRKHLERAKKELSATGAPRVLCFGADLEKAGACLVAQIGLSTPLSLDTLCRETVLELLRLLVADGWRCVIGMEACGFGWRFQRQIREVGGEALTFATEALTGWRKTNRRDATALAHLVIFPTVKHLIEALQLADLTVRRVFRPERSKRTATGSPAEAAAEVLAVAGRGRARVSAAARINGRCFPLGSIQGR